MKRSQIKSFLQEEVKEQVLFEIAPLLHLGTSQGGYFGLPRQILCMIDFLASVYVGFDEQRDVDKRKNKPDIIKISSPWKMVKFIKEIIGEHIDENYSESADYLVEMYRHGLVHLYQPKELKLGNNKILSWMPYKGERENATVTADKTYENVTHLKIYESNKFEDGKVRLPVSTKCLYYDLIRSIDIYTDLLSNDNNLVENWNSAVNGIVEPSEFMRKEGVGV